MKWLPTTILGIATIILAASVQYKDFAEYMRPFFRAATVNTVTKSLRTNKTLSRMSPSSTFVGLPVIPADDPSLNAVNPKPRAIRTVFEAIEQSEGAGATVRRSIGTPKLRNFTPFLMLDHFNVAVGAVCAILPSLPLNVLNRGVLADLKFLGVSRSSTPRPRDYHVPAQRCSRS